VSPTHTFYCTMDNTDSVSIASSEISDTSTEMIGHEPFSTFQHKIFSLCKKNWPNLATDAYEVAHMEGGSFNRVVAVRVDASKTRSPWLKRHAKKVLHALCPSTTRQEQIREYVVRIPRYEHAWVENEVATLLFLATTDVPAPKIKSFDLSTDNPIGSRFSIHPRLPGKSVEESYLDLTTSQRCSFAHELGTALKALSNIRSPCPGTLDPASILKGSSSLQILQLQCPPRNAQHSTATEFSNHSAPTSVYDFMISQFARQRTRDMFFHRPNIAIWTKFFHIIDVLNKEGLFEDNEYYLTHMDLEPRNIMLSTSSPFKASLSGILDWDESLFAPVFLSCRPPSWLWDFKGENEEELDEAVAHKDPEDEDLLAIKRAFENAVGQVWCAYAYKTEYRLARDIVRLAINGFRSNDDYDVAARVVKEWDELRPDSAVGELEDE
jgi:hypothetical protein